MTPISFTQFCDSVLGVQLTRPQVVLCRVAFDGVDPVDLPWADRAIAHELFGDVERVPSEARLVNAWLKGARVGGSWLCSLQLLHAALTTSLDTLAAGEVGFGAIVAPDLKTGRVALNYVRGAAKAVPSIARLITEDKSDKLGLRRPDGREVSIETLAASRGGASTRGRSYFGALLDESSFFRDSDSVVNDAEIFRAIAPRVVPGGRLNVISTAWAEAGWLWTAVQKNHGSPKSALAAKAPTLTMRPDHAQIRAVVAEERERDPENAAREFDCVPFSGDATGFFAADSLESSKTDAPLILEPRAGQHAVAGVDVAFRRDASALVIVRRNGNAAEVCEVVELKPSPGQPLVPSEVVKRFVERAKYHGVRELVADSYYLESVREHMAGAPLSLVTAPAGQAGKVEVHIAAQSLIHEGKFLVSASHGTLLRQLSEIRSKPTSGGGLSITSPRRAGSHGDVASALVLALWRLGSCRGTGKVSYEGSGSRDKGWGSLHKPAPSVGDDWDDDDEDREREYWSL